MVRGVRAVVTAGLEGLGIALVEEKLMAQDAYALALA
jgi:hypothetical protein